MSSTKGPAEKAWDELDDVKSKLSRSMTVDQWTIEYGRAGRLAIAELRDRLEQAEAALAEMKERHTHRWTQAVGGVETEFDVELVPKPELDTALAALADIEEFLASRGGLLSSYRDDLRARAEEGKR